MTLDKSKKMFASAKTLIPGGVNSPVRACKSVGDDPLFIDRARGSLIYDVDGNEYIDYVGSWGPMILGHNHPAVTEAVGAVLQKGTSFGAPTELEVELARTIVDALPAVDMVRMVNSGTEAAMSAIRLARGVTGRDRVIKFDGCYHGHADSLLVAAGSGVATLGIPGSPGIPAPYAALTDSLPFNDVDVFSSFMQQHGDQVAAVIVEPVAGNMGLVPPADGFLELLRDLTAKSGSLLIFDEVMTGFRVAYGGAQTRYGIFPDLSCFGKIIGGGLPVGAYGGRAEIMKQIAPQGPVYQAGTLSGNPVAMAAGLATLQQLQQTDVYATLEDRSARLEEGIRKAAADNAIPVATVSVGSMLGLFFTERPVRNFEDAKTSNLDAFGTYYRLMRQKGIYLAPSQFEALFVSTAHTEEQIDRTIAAAAETFAQLRR